MRRAGRGGMLAGMSRITATPAVLPTLPDHLPDIRLIACDMDGTLLDDAHAIHDDFWPLVRQLHQRGILFCPASGRQYHNLFERFSEVAADLAFIAENGCLVMQGGRELSSACVSTAVAHALIRQARALRSRGVEVDCVLCGKRSAWVESRDSAFVAVVSAFYHHLGVVEDLLAVEDDFLKVALYHPHSAETFLEGHFQAFRGEQQVAVSGIHWLDVMPLATNKGSGVRSLQQRLGISRAQTLVFGDYLNDLEMMDEADYAFAMANAHPLLKARAAYIAPPNTENGVIRTIRAVLGLASGQA